MGNSNETQSIDKIRLLIERELIANGDRVMQIQDCYLGYFAITIQYVKEPAIMLSPIAEGIIGMFNKSNPLKLSDLSDLFCTDEAVILQALQQLQHTYIVTLSPDEQIVALTPIEQPHAVYEESIVINPTVLKKVEFESDYTIPCKQIVAHERELTEENVYKLFPHLEDGQLQQWTSRLVAGPHLYKVTLYNQADREQRVVLYNEDGQLLYEMERTSIDLSGALLEQQEPDWIVSFKEGMERLHADESWTICCNESLPRPVVALIEHLKKPVLLLFGENVQADELKKIDILEKQSKGLLTAIPLQIAKDFMFIGEQVVVKQLSKEQLAIYEEPLFIASKQEQIKQALIELAKQSDSPIAMKVFIYLVEQKTANDILRNIVLHLAPTSASERLIQRGKILDNHGYKILAKEVYELGITAHAQEVNGS